MTSVDRVESKDDFEDARIACTIYYIRYLEHFGTFSSHQQTANYLY